MPWPINPAPATNARSIGMPGRVLRAGPGVAREPNGSDDQSPAGGGSTAFAGLLMSVTSRVISKDPPEPSPTTE